MIEFEDLTPWNRDELINFYPVLFDTLACGKIIKAMKGFQFDEVVCFLKKGHPGECLCWTPKYGIISRL